MEIVRRGNIPEEREWYGVCQHCQSEARALEKELNIERPTRAGERPFAWHKCPVCGTGTEHSGYGGMLFYLAPPRHMTPNAKLSGPNGPQEKQR